MEKLKSILENSEIIIKEELVRKIDIGNIADYLNKKDMQEVETKEDILSIIKDKYNLGAIILDYRDLQSIDFKLKK